MNKKLKLKIVIMVLFIILVSISPIVYGVSINSLKYVGSVSGSTYDILGTINGSTELITTYNKKGYGVYLKVGTNEGSIMTSNSTTIDGVTLTITGTQSTTTSVKVTYTIKNTTSSPKSYSIATTADIMLGSNDKAAILKNGKSSMQITQDDSTKTSDYGAQVNIAFSPAANTAWIGKYNDRDSNKYNDSTKDSYTYVDSVDTGMAASWSGTINANSTKTYTATFTAKKANNGTAKFHRYGTGEIVKTEEVLIGGTIKAPSVLTETGYTYKWNTNTSGTGTSYDGGSGIILTQSSMDFYEIRTPNTYTITLNNQSAQSAGTASIYETYNTKYSLTNNGEAMTTTSNNIQVPTKIGNDFGGYYTQPNGQGTQYINENGYITANASTTNFTSNGTLYAKWTPKTYEIKYNPNEGTINGEYPETYVYGTTTQLPTDVTKEGYKFVGWYDNSELSGNPVKTITTTDYENKEYWAKWAKIIENPIIEVQGDFEYIYDKLVKTPNYIVKDGDQVIPSSEYTISYINNLNAGTATVIIKNIENGYYSFTNESTFKINQKSILDDTISVTLQKNEYIYAGSPFEIVPVITDSENGTTNLVLGRDFTLEYQDNIDVGEATIKIKGIGNYKDERTITFNIIKADSTNPTIKNTIKEYNGNAIEIETEVGEGGTIYYATSEDNINWSEWTTTKPSRVNTGTTYVKAYVKGDKNHNDSSETGVYTLTVIPRKLIVKAEPNGKMYNDADPLLNYTYENNVEGETPKFSGKLERVEGEELGNYTINIGDLDIVDNGAFKVSNYEIEYISNIFTIREKEINELDIILVKDIFSYDGTEHEPEIIVKDGDKIVPSSEYTIEYFDNVNVGEAIVKITDKEGGNYIVNGTKTFKIIDTVAPTISGVKDNEKYYEDVTLTFSDDIGVVKVTDNGKIIDLINEPYIIKQDNMVHIIKAYDEAGNCTTIHIGVYETYTVKYIVDGEIIKVIENVKYGTDINDIPGIPAKIGYDDIAPVWDHNSKNITSDLEIHAVYKKNSLKKFIDTKGKTMYIDKDGNVFYKTEKGYKFAYNMLNPKTGDNIWQYIIMFIASSIGLIALSKRKK